MTHLRFPMNERGKDSKPWNDHSVPSQRCSTKPGIKPYQNISNIIKPLERKHLKTWEYASCGMLWLACAGQGQVGAHHLGRQLALLQCSWHVDLMMYEVLVTWSLFGKSRLGIHRHSTFLDGDSSLTAGGKTLRSQISDYDMVTYHHAGESQ